MANTQQEYQQVIQGCRTLFAHKTHDYGTAWRILRLPSLTDQIWIKAKRIRSIQEKGEQRIQDSIKSEFVAIINYCLMALIQIDLADDTRLELPEEEILQYYDHRCTQNWELLANKNHDYDEAWREMRLSSITDIILMKLLRIKQIEDHAGHTRVSEGVEAGYQDIINYAIFCVIKLAGENTEN